MACQNKIVSLTREHACWLEQREISATKFMRHAIEAAMICDDSRDLHITVLKLQAINRRIQEIMSEERMIHATGGTR